MLERFTNWLFSEWMPHIQCLRNDIGIVALQVTGDSLIWAAYIAIAAGMLHDYRLYGTRISVSGGSGTARLYVWFGAFIFFCALTHAMKVLTVWRGYYLLDGLVGLATAVASWGTIFISTLEHRRGNVTWKRADLDEARAVFASSIAATAAATRQLKREVQRAQKRHSGVRDG